MTIETDPKQAGIEARRRQRLEARASRLAALEDDGEVRAEVEVLLWSVGPQQYGVRLSKLDSIAQVNEVTALPGAPAFILGLVRQRGRYLTLVNVSELLLPGQPGLTDVSKAVVVREGNRLLAFAASELHDVLMLSQKEIDSARSSPDGLTRALKLPAQVVGLLEAGALLADPRFAAEGAAGR